MLDVPLLFDRRQRRSIVEYESLKVDVPRVVLKSQEESI